MTQTRRLNDVIEDLEDVKTSLEEVDAGVHEPSRSIRRRRTSRRRPTNWRRSSATKKRNPRRQVRGVSHRPEFDHFQVQNVSKYYNQPTHRTEMTNHSNVWTRRTCGAVMGCPATIRPSLSSAVISSVSTDRERQIHRVVHGQAGRDGHGMRVDHQTTGRDGLNGDSGNIGRQSPAFVGGQFAPSHLLPYYVSDFREQQVRRQILMRCRQQSTRCVAVDLWNEPLDDDARVEDKTLTECRDPLESTRRCLTVANAAVSSATVRTSGAFRQDCGCWPFAGRRGFRPEANGRGPLQPP